MEIHSYPKWLKALYSGFPAIVSGVTYLGVVCLVVNEFTQKAFGFEFFVMTSESKVRVLIGLLVAVAVSVNVRLAQLHKDLERIQLSQSGSVEVHSSSNRLNIRELLATKDVIRILTLSGTTIGQLGDDGVKEMLADPRRQSRITILLANPDSPAIITRYQADEPSDYVAGTEGIRRRLYMLHQISKQLPEPARKRLVVGVYDNYPTVSLIQADSDLYSTIYAFRLRGGDCPRIKVDAGGEYGRFLMRHYDRMLEVAVPLEKWIAKQSSSNSGAPDNVLPQPPERVP